MKNYQEVTVPEDNLCTALDWKLLSKEGEVYSTNFNLLQSDACVHIFVHVQIHHFELQWK